MRHYRLSDEDRERLGIKDEWISFDPSRLMFSEAEALEDSGYDTDQLLEDLRGYEVVDKTGSPVMVPVIDDDGNPALNEDGTPQRVPKMRFPTRGIRAAIWLAARRAGCDVPFSEFDIDMAGVRFELELPGKDPELDPASPS